MWTAMIVVALVLSSGHGHGDDGIVGALAIIAWIGGIATSFSIRGAYDRVVEGLRGKVVFLPRGS